jgi:predicted Zn-dependent peptidase
MAEHMLFQGTASFDQLALNMRAAELGGEHNADTGHEDIAMTFEVFNEDFDSALGLLAEQFYRTRIEPARFVKERRVVLDEIRGRADDPAEQVHTQAWNHFFRGALAHPVWGSVRSLKAMRPADVSRFLRRNFVHRRAVSPVSGGPRSARRRAPSPVISIRATQPALPLPRSGPGRAGTLRLRRRNGSQSYVVRMIALPRQPRRLIAVGIALDLVGSDPDSHLFQAIRERHGLGYDVSASIEWGRDWAVAVIAASGSRGQSAKLVRVTEETLRAPRTRASPPTSWHGRARSCAIATRRWRRAASTAPWRWRRVHSAAFHRHTRRSGWWNRPATPRSSAPGVRRCAGGR